MVRWYLARKDTVIMKTNIRILSLLLVLLMLFTACEGIGGAGTESDTSVTTETQSVETENIDTTDESESQSAEQTTKPSSEITSETKTETQTETKLETTSETETETETETKQSPEEYRKSISRSREEIEAMLTIKDEDFTDAAAKLTAFEKIAIESNDMDAIDAVYLEFDEAYNYISTQVSISSVIYYIDMSDEAAYERYNKLYDKYGDLYNAYVASCKKIYNESSIRDEIFADWTPEEISQMLNYSDKSQELTLKNDELTNELNNLSDEEFFDRSAQIYAEIVKNNNLIAELAGYDNYYDYASKEIYGRDYSRKELELFCNTVAEKYVPKYGGLYDSVFNYLALLDNNTYNALVSYLYDPFDQQDKNYLKNYISSLSGSMKEGMEHAFINRNMVFSNAENSHPSAFQTYLDDMDMPFCLFGVNGQATSSIVHEIGHYYASLYAPELASYDLAEVQSQGNEMLLLNYLADDMPYSMRSGIEKYIMYSNFTTIISCCIIDEFERAVYALDSVDGYGSKEFDEIMTKVCEKYGGVAFIEENMGDMYGYWRQVATNNPVYYISYAVSLTSAMNIYAELKTDRAAGREMYRILVEEVSEDDTFLSALKKAGLPSPFSDECTDKIVSTLLK